MEEPLEIPIMNDLTMVLGSISQVLQPYVGEKMYFTPSVPQYLCMIAFAIGFNDVQRENGEGTCGFTETKSGQSIS